MDDLIATKAFSYNTRRLVAGDLFQARRSDARLLVALKKAKRPVGGVASEELDVVVVPVQVIETSHTPPDTMVSQVVPTTLPETPSAVDVKALDIAALRAQYKDMFGKAPFNGWKAEELIARIAAGKDAE